MAIHEIPNDTQQTIATYMDDDIRESIHNILAPCSFSDFLNIYCDLDPSFTILLRQEFDITDFDVYDTSYINLVCSTAGLQKEFVMCDSDEVEDLLELAYERLSLKPEQEHAYHVYYSIRGIEDFDYEFKSYDEARDRVYFLRSQGIASYYRKIY